MTLECKDPLFADLLSLARDLALRAGKIQRDRYETGLQIDTKSATIDLVTEVDRECEALIVEGIQARRKDDAILAEEGHGTDWADAEIRWIIDPLDGTTNFAHGFPRFCVSIGIEVRGERAIGVVFDPLLDECFEAARGEGAWLGARQSVARRGPCAVERIQTAKAGSGCQPHTRQQRNASERTNQVSQSCH